MKAPSEESKFELDLDNRKLILGFVLLMVIFAGFFVFGFVEGKRQARQIDQVGTDAAAPESRAAAAGVEGKAPDQAVTQVLDEKKVSEQLDWYKSVNSSTGAKAEKKAEPDKSTQTKSARSGAKADKPAAGTLRPSPGTDRTSYTVQVGAFRLAQEAEKKAAALKAKGYASYIEPPKAPNDYYLLKVGRFDSRTTAIEMQMRLKKDGFTTLIKTN